MTPRLELVSLSKRYPSVLANDAVSLEVLPGEIHAVLGENGAGKSTLVKMIYGAVTPDSGEIRFDGRAVRIKDPKAARALGVAMVFQHFSLFDTLSVLENIWLGLEGVSRAEVRAELAQLGARYGLPLEADRPVYTLSVGERQRVEIVRALLSKPRLLILDEPTSVLTPQAVQALFDTLRLIAQGGCSIVYISHKLDEIRALCSVCTVLRAGKVTGRVDPRECSNAQLSELMIGHAPARLEHAARIGQEVALACKELSLPALTEFQTALHGINLQVRAGEIVGIAGVSGNGQQELFSALSGEDTRASRGIEMHGEDVTRLGPAARRALGLAHVPEERLGRGAVPAMSLAQNSLLTHNRSPWSWLSPPAAQRQAAQIIQAYAVKAGGPKAVAQSLSGGNLQKFIVGRELSAQPRVLLIAQPSWGVDVGSAAQIHAAIQALAESGCAVLLVSEELDELFELCHRLYVISGGRLSPSVARADARVQTIGAWMSGLWDQADGKSTGDKHVAA